MKQFLLYVLYVGIIFVIQMAVLGLLSVTDVATNLRDVLYLFYFLPAGLILSIFMLTFGNDSLDLLPKGGFLLTFLAGLVALFYSIVIGTIIWVISYIIIRIRDNGRKT